MRVGVGVVGSRLILDTGRRGSQGEIIENPLGMWYNTKQILAMILGNQYLLLVNVYEALKGKKKIIIIIRPPRFVTNGKHSRLIH